jgi:hypothetical protein
MRKPAERHHACEQLHDVSDIRWPQLLDRACDGQVLERQSANHGELITQTVARGG